MKNLSFKNVYSTQKLFKYYFYIYYYLNKADKNTNALLNFSCKSQAKKKKV